MCPIISPRTQKHRVPVQGIPCLEKWLFCKERNQLAEKWHQQARNRKGLLIKLGMIQLKLLHCIVASTIECHVILPCLHTRYSIMLYTCISTLHTCYEVQYRQVKSQHAVTMKWFELPALLITTKLSQQGSHQPSSSTHTACIGGMECFSCATSSHSYVLC